jgi:hypothetical protein
MRGKACALICVAALVSLSSCADPAPDGVSSRQVRVDAQSLFERWHGTDLQRSAAEVLVAYGANSQTANCVRHHGFRWDWSNGTQGVAPEDALGLTVLLAEPKVLAMSRTLLAVNGAARAGVHMNSHVTLSPAGEKVLTNCLNSYHGISDDAVEAIRGPASSEKLMAEWVSVLRSVTKRFGSIQDYDRCMTRAQLSLLAGKPYGDVNFGLAISSAAPPPGKIPMPGERPTREWTRFMALDREVATADWNCRKGFYDEAMTDVAPLLETFESTHESQIGASEQHWQHVEQQAVRLGWDPRTGRVSASSDPLWGVAR